MPPPFLTLPLREKEQMLLRDLNLPDYSHHFCLFSISRQARN